MGTGKGYGLLAMPSKKMNDAASISDAQATISAAQAKAEQEAAEKARENAARVHAAVSAFAAVTATPLREQSTALVDASDSIKATRDAIASALFADGWQARVAALVAAIDSQMQACATRPQAEAHLLCVRLASECDASDYNSAVVSLSALSQRMPTASKVSPLIARELRALKTVIATSRRAALDVASVTSDAQRADYDKQAQLREQRASERRAKLVEMQAAMLPSAGASSASEQDN